MDQELISIKDYINKCIACKLIYFIRPKVSNYKNNLFILNKNHLEWLKLFILVSGVSSSLNGLTYNFLKLYDFNPVDLFLAQ